MNDPMTLSSLQCRQINIDRSQATTWSKGESRQRILQGALLGVMSLFQAQEWWSAKSSVDHEFAHGAMCLSPFNGSSGKSNLVIVGSLGGNLRIYHPLATHGSGDIDSNDLLHEVDLDQPILQVESGRFVDRDSQSLCVLHPRKVTVYTLKAMYVQPSHTHSFPFPLPSPHLLASLG